jgi:outer membrane protein W
MKVILLCFLFTIIPKAHAFDWGLHRSVTSRALSPLGFSIRSIDQVADANIYIDRIEGNSPPTHVDSESFEAASALMRSRLKLTAISIIKGDMKAARTTFGYITHTVQDFYAHTNYVEFMPGQPIDLLHLTKPRGDVTCSKNSMLNGLTSGYYPDSSTPAKKCSHSILNKDSGAETAAGAKALKYAVSATTQMYGVLEQLVLSLSSDQQKAYKNLASFRDDDNHSIQQFVLEKSDVVALTAYNETFKVTPYVGITQFSSDQLDFESTYTIGVKIETRVNERVTTGFGITQSSMKIKENAVSEFDYSGYGVNLFSNLYLISDSRFRPYLGAGLGYLKSSLTNANNNSGTSTLNGEIRGGIDLMYTRKIGLNLEASYVKAISSSTYHLGQYPVDKLAHALENSGHTILSIGMIISF